MNYTAPTWTEYLNSTFNSPFAQTLFYAALVAVALVVLSVVWKRVAKWIFAPSAQKTPRLSRATKNQLAREGYQLVRVNERVGYRNSRHYTYR